MTEEGFRVNLRGPPHVHDLYMFSSIADDNEGSSSDTAPLFQMAGDGKNTDDITIPMLFLFSKEGNIILDAMREYLEVEVLLSDKAKDRGKMFLLFLLMYLDSDASSFLLCIISTFLNAASNVSNGRIIVYSFNLL